MTPKPRLRFAPSPTGPLHLGGARTALYNWAAARAAGGAFLLRIEDTDRARSSDASLRIILAGLRWLGIDWDEGPEVGGPHGPYFQSQRLDVYARYAQRLLESGAAYRCYATPAEVEAGRERLRALGQNPMYDRRDRDLTDGQRAAYEREGRVASLRFRMPLDGTWRLDDLCKGAVALDLRELDDWVMLRPDGMPTYNFACVVDDLEMGITHVVRGEEHLSNGFKQAVLFDALGAAAPRYSHIPLILGKSGKKLSKREADTNMLDYRDKGYVADAVFNYIALLGWSFSGDRDVFTRAEMVERFRIEDIGKSGAKFDEEKLLWMSGDYVRRMDRDELVAQCRPFLEAGGAVPAAAFATHPGLVANAVACFQERMQLFGELPDKLAFLFVDEIELDADARKKLEQEPAAGAWLSAYADLLAASDLPPSYPDERAACDAFWRVPLAKDAAPPDPAGAPCAGPPWLEQSARDLAERLGIKFGSLVHPIRAALSGTTRGPGLFDVVFLLGKARAVARLRRFAG
jgi:glutamyl-tRNA synthetase